MLPVNIEQCAPAVHPITMSAIVMHESGGNPLAIHNNSTGMSYKPKSVREAVALAHSMIERGESVDLGLAQINSANLIKLGLTTQTVFDPCRNLSAAQVILLEGWRKSGGDLEKTLSVYNTGLIDSAAGSRYAKAVYKVAGVVIPAIPSLPSSIEKKGIKFDYDSQSQLRLQPIRVKIEWTPVASPFAPKSDSLQPHW